MASQLETALARFRAQLLARDAQAITTIMREYDAALLRLRPMIAALEADAALLVNPTVDDLFSLTRWRMLERALQEEVDRIARLTGNRIVEAQRTTIAASSDKARQLALASARSQSAVAQIVATWTRLPITALNDLIGNLQPSSPLGELLGSMGRDALAVARQKLIDASIGGVNPRTVAAQIDAALGISRNRALLISRTELLRVDRSATLREYAENGDVLKGWYWSCAKQSRTCAACLALDGRLFALTDQFMRNHPGCRCAPRPALIRDTKQPQTGAEWLAKQPYETQRQVLGTQGAEAYQAGDVALDDFVRLHSSEVWGESYSNGGVAHAKARANQRRGATP